jgi:hypothetical protein
MVREQLAPFQNCYVHAVAVYSLPKFAPAYEAPVVPAGTIDSSVPREVATKQNDAAQSVTLTHKRT